MQYKLNRITSTSIFRFSLYCICFLFLHFSLSAQKKLSFADAYEGDESKLKSSLPVFRSWDKNGLLEMERNDSLITFNPVKQTIVEGKWKHSMLPPAIIMGSPENRELDTWSPNRSNTVMVVNNNIVLRYSTKQGAAHKNITTDGNDSILNGKASYVYKEEITGPNTMKWDHSGNIVAFMRFDESNVPVYSLYIPEGQHGHLEKQRYPKAGNRNPTVRIGIYSVETDKLVWADFPPDDDQIFGTLSFTPSNKLLVRWMNRGQDTLRVYEVEPTNGKKKLLYEETQPTWVNINNAADFDYIDGGKNLIITSDKTGRRHAYLHKPDGSLINAITSGDYDVTHFLGVDEKKRIFYFGARKENSARIDIYAAGLDGNGFRRISKGNFHYTNVHFSPDFQYFVANYSSIDKIACAAVFDKNGNKIFDLADARGSNFNEYTLPKKSLVRVKSTDGLFDLPVVIVYPVNFDSTKQYPVLMTVYGGPDAGKVYDEWSSSLSEIYWAQQGLIQVMADNRASGHFGKKAMDMIHRQVGIYEIEDFMAVGRWLKQQPYVLPNKLGITGFSYGGYMTCMALTYGADVFDYGIDYYGNTDWSLYDTHFTERYMDSPEENPEGYKKTAIKTWLHKYKGMLRIIHGNSDNNVHPQHSLEIANQLQEMGKHFEFAMYPGVRHGFRGKKWLHSKKELAIFINKYLLMNLLLPVDN